MNRKNDIPVAIVSPDPLFLFALRGVLGKDRRARISGVTESLGTLQEELESSLVVVKVVVCDLDALDPAPDFFGQLQNFLDRYPSIAVICLAEGALDRSAIHIQDIPVAAFLSKRDLGYCLHLVIHAVIDHRVILLTKNTFQRLERQSFLALHGRVLDIEQSHPNLVGRIEEIAMSRMVIGLNNTDIQDELLLSPNTVRGYVSKVYKALDVSGEQAAFEAMSEWWWLTRFSGILDSNLRYANVPLSS